MILILTEATSRTGLGHFTRCSALAEVLAEHGKLVTIAVITDHMPLPADRAECTVITQDWRISQIFSEILRRTEAVAVVVDSYLATSETYQELAGQTDHLFCFDDYNRLQYPRRSKIINPGIGGQFVDYHGQQAKVFTGIQYTLLRKPFRQTFDLPETRTSIEDILITVGAEDRWNLLPELIRHLNSTETRVRQHIILGPAFQNETEVLQCAGPQTHIYKSITATEIRDLMLGCDLAITAGGQTTNELVRCGLPMIVLQIAENQAANIRGWLHSGLITEFCDRQSDAVAFIKSQLFRLGPTKYRKQMRHANPDDLINTKSYVDLLS